MKSSKLQILILACDEYDIPEYSENTPKRTLFRITENSIERFDSDFNGEWNKTAIDVPRDLETDKVRSTFKTLKALGSALEVFSYRHGWKSPPPLTALVRKPTDFHFEKNKEGWLPLFKKMPVDAWGKAIMRQELSALRSSGPDGKFYTEDDLIHSLHD